MKTRSLVSIDDLTTGEIMKILKLAAEFEKDPVQEILHGKVVATLFFEPSTRTRLSFESAVSKLGGKSHWFHRLLDLKCQQGRDAE